MSYVSDNLPPTFVREWRRFLHAKAFMIVAAVFYCVVWLILLSENWKEINTMMEYTTMPELSTNFFFPSVDTKAEVAQRMSILSIKMFLAAAVPMLFILPLRMSGAVAADTRVKGTNFLQVTPLSTWKIVWGMWLASFSQALVLAALYIPVVLVRAHLMPMGCEQDWGYLLALVLFSGLYSALFLFSGGLTGMLRFGLLAFSIIAAIYLPFGLNNYFNGTGADNVVFTLVCDLICMGLGVYMLLLLARRPYAAPAENTSLSLRLLSVACVLVSFGLVVWNICHPGFFQENAELDFVTTFLLVLGIAGTVLDAILPTYSMPVHALRTLPGLPAWPQMPGLLQSSVFVLPGLYVMALGICAAGQASLGAEEGGDMFASFYLAIPIALAFWTPLLLSLWIVDFMCRRIRPARPLLVLVMGFAIFMTLSTLMGAAALVTQSEAVAKFFAYMPFLYVLAIMGNLAMDMGMKDLQNDYATHLVITLAEAVAALALLTLRARSGKVVR